MSSRAEILALQGQFDQAIRLLQNAKNISQNNKMNSARINARISEIEQLQKRYAVYQR